MPGPILHVGATMTCPHGGQVTTIPGSQRVMVSGMPVATMADTYLIAGCAFTIPPGRPQPCIKVHWTVPAIRVQVAGQPVIIQTSVGHCQGAEQISQGPTRIIAAQPRVIAT